MLINRLIKALGKDEYERFKELINIANTFIRKEIKVELELGNIIENIYNLISEIKVLRDKI